ncbi:PQQ-dependent sugar dehydrogenase [Reinekea sp.]|jgi:glucose/arabinose dehydrogenase|uniref:PQQ-dependent sugar dehydrogenase n=1 Tax=Reinekea sp. TaxID=1970455 RepID=UPI00398A2CAF
MTKILVFVCCFLPFFAYAERTIDYIPVFESLHFDRPTLLTHAGDSSERIFIVEQAGSIKVFQQNKEVKQTSVFFDLAKMTENKISVSGEEGLLGLAFDPDYKNNGYFYVYYSAKSPRRSVISRFSTSKQNKNMAMHGSEKILLEIPQPYSNHNGGMIAFGADGYLYIGTGDGGSAGDPQHYAQNLASLLGKILRVDVNGKAANGNPFEQHQKAEPRVWAYGLRNPWRFSFDRATGQLWAADVGQNAWEEVNRVTKAGNYGWRWFEGTHEYRVDEQTHAKVIDPIFEYSHKDGNSITGGYVYRGKTYPELVGWYHFGDFVSGQMWTLNTADSNATAIKTGRINNPSGFGEDEQGELYVLSYQGKLFRVVSQP